MSRCRPGDLAMVVRNIDGNEGRLVHVDRRSWIKADGAIWWVVTTLQQFKTADIGIVPPGSTILAADCDLRPIRGGDGVDETLRWASLPSTPARVPVRLPTEKARP